MTTLELSIYKYLSKNIPFTNKIPENILIRYRKDSILISIPMFVTKIERLYMEKNLLNRKNIETTRNNLFDKYIQELKGGLEEIIGTEIISLDNHFDWKKMILHRVIYLK